jgi:hypothetical protein
VHVILLSICVCVYARVYEQHRDVQQLPNGLLARKVYYYSRVASSPVCFAYQMILM